MPGSAPLVHFFTNYGDKVSEWAAGLKKKGKVTARFSPSTFTHPAAQRLMSCTDTHPKVCCVQGTTEILDQYGFVVPGNPLDRLELDNQYPAALTARNSIEDPAHSAE